MKETWVCLHLDLVEAQVSESPHRSKLDRQIGSRSSSALGRAGVAADLRARSKESLSVILEHRVRKLLSEHLVHWVFAVEIQPKPDITKQYRKSEWCRLMVVVVRNWCHLHSSDQRLVKQMNQDA